MTVEFLPSFSILAARYDAFILDLWGVIHDGQKMYPGAKDCLERLRGSGKKIVLLSNAPRRASVAAETLQRMGIRSGDYDALITSGEAAYTCLVKGENFQPAGNRYIYIGLERDRRLLEGLPFQETDDPQAAHFLLLSHSFYDNQPMSELEPLLARCLTVKLPALCVNPDSEVVRITGERVYCAGVLAEEYAAKGGQVTYFGKPHPVVYNMAFKTFVGIDKPRILAVGDNLATDILGAHKNRVKSALVTGGILRDELGEPGTDAYAARLKGLLAQAESMPDYALAAFNWQPL